MNKARFLLPNFFTSLNFLLGVWSILLAANAFPDAFHTRWEGILLAANLIVIGALTDKLDGFAAKFFNASSDFGAQFDSLADLVAFGIAPPMVAIFAIREASPEWFQAHKAMLMVSLSVYVLCAAMRLARYNAIDVDGHPGYFTGMPTTMAGSIMALAVILCASSDAFGLGQVLLLDPQVLRLWPAFLVLLGVLMVSTLYLPKLRGRKNRWFNYFQMGIVLAGYICGLTMSFPEFLFLTLLVYFIGGFGHGLVKREQLDGECAAIQAEHQAESK